MTHDAFYHLTKSTMEEALPKLLEHTLNAGKRALVKANSADRVKCLSSALWTEYNDSWLPHGIENNEHAIDQPIWLTLGDENPNMATYIFLVDGDEIPDITAFERCFDLFDGNDDDNLAAARNRWRLLKDSGHELHYWQQNERGLWEEKK